jgi:uncharacterized protein YkwD
MPNAMAVARWATAVIAAVALAAAASLLAASPVIPGGLENADAASCANADAMPRDISRGEAAQAVRCLINDRRRDHGRSQLGGRHSLDSSARRHTQRMKSKRCFLHECPGEPGLLRRVMATSYLPCRCTWSVGENIAWGTQKLGTPEAVVKAWMNSPEHRANILNRRFEHLGVGVQWGTPRNPGANGGVYTTDFGFKR